MGGGGSFTYTGSYSGLSEAYKNGFAIICSFFIFHLSKEFRAGQDILENRVIGIVPRIVMVDIILNDNPIIYNMDSVSGTSCWPTYKKRRLHKGWPSGEAYICSSICLFYQCLKDSIHIQVALKAGRALRN